MKKILVLNPLFIAWAVLLFFTGCKKENTPVLPVVITSQISSIDASMATSGGNVTSDGGDDISARGVCWSTNQNPSIDLATKTNDGTGSGEFTSSITGLQSGVTYHVRAYATNSAGTAYGTDVSFTTKALIPTITTTAFTSITSTSAISGGNITSDGGAPIIAKGVCWSIDANPTVNNSKTNDGTGFGTFTSTLSGLTESTVYHARAYATNSVGTAYGLDITFTTTTTGSSTSDNDNMMLGNPSSATADIVNANNYLMIKPQYCLSYNNSKLTPNWTSWHLYSGDVGSTNRQDDFRADITLPTGWYRVTETDFQYSTYGFDRGHMCPSADRTSSTENNSATFLMTNMIPQAPNNNQQTWANLENYCRTLIDAGNELYIICGPYGQGGTSAKGTFSTLNSGVVVPSKTWKIIVVLANGNNDLSRITTSTRVIVVEMPNIQNLDYNWRNHRVSVDAIEALTGYNFLSNISTAIQDAIEAKVDNL